MAMTGVLRPGHIQLKVLDLDESVDFYSNTLGLIETGRDAQGRVYFKTWDERDHHSVILRQADSAGIDFFAFKVDSEATLDKVIRNVASSWEQAGHLVGRTFKMRALVRATPGSVAFGLYLGHAVGFRGASLFATGWVSLLDCTPVAARDLAIEAKRIGLIDLRIAGDVVDLALDRLDPAEGRS